MGMFSGMIRRSVTGEDKEEDKSVWTPDITPEELHEKMKEGIVHFKYLKKDGKTERDAWGTNDMKTVTEFTSEPKGGHCPPKRAGYSIYYDLQVEGWRAYWDGNLMGAWSKIYTVEEFDKELAKIVAEKAKAEAETAEEPVPEV